ncbi:MAG: hypothetical protein QXT13_12970 [Pyrobaculum sp.]
MFVQVKDPLTSRMIAIPYNASWFEKIEPGVYVDGRDNAVVEVGRFGFNAPDKKMRSKPLYVAIIEQKLNVDPPTFRAGQRLCEYGFRGVFCLAPSTHANRTWQNCVDSAYGQGEGTNCYASNIVSNYNFQMCVLSGSYGPFFYALQNMPSSSGNILNQSGTKAYSPPCPLADVASIPSTTNTSLFKMTDTLKVRGVGCLDTSVNPAVTRISYSTQDGIGNSYTVSTVGIGYLNYISDEEYALLPWTLLQVQQFTKNQNDIYYYIYRIAFNLGGNTAPWV